MSQLEQAAPTERDRVIIRGFADCGLRLEELTRLNAGDLIRGDPESIRVEPRTLLTPARHDARASARVLCHFSAGAVSCECTGRPYVARPQRLRPTTATSEAGQPPGLTLDSRQITCADKPRRVAHVCRAAPLRARVGAPQMPRNRVARTAQTARKRGADGVQTEQAYGVGDPDTGHRHGRTT